MATTETQKAKNKVGAFLAGALTTLAVGGYVLYGPGGKRNRKALDSWVVKAKAEILERVNQIQDITEREYRRIVDDVMEKYESATEVGVDKAQIVGEKFKRAWRQIRTRTKQAARNASRAAADALDQEADELEE